MSCEKKNETIQVLSPDADFEVTINNENELSYSVSWNNSVVIADSKLGFKLIDSTIVGGELKIVGIDKSSRNEEWIPVYGEKAAYNDTYNETKITFSSANSSVSEFALCVRAFNEGVAFRYEFNQKEPLLIDSELTEFSFIDNPNVWVSRRAQKPIEKKRISEVDYLCDRPLLAELNDSIYLALGEAALVDFARMKFSKCPDSKNKLVVALGQDDNESPKDEVIIPEGKYATPWRYIMAAESPAKLLQNNFLVLNLNDPNQLDDVSWIKPGKVIREVTLTTKGGIACVDFAVKHNLQFIEFDAGWYGNEYDNASDATTVTVDPKRSPGPLDLKGVIDYAKTKGVGVILYVNRRSLEKQIDDVLPLLKSWGVEGLKYGFVNVGPQDWTSWLHDAVRKAASHGLMVDIHDEYRPTGYSRTYPNLMTQEGIRGDEERTPNDMVINTIFTRMIAGAGDQTNCYFAERVLEMGSHASQMAKTICIYSPWQFLYWYDRPTGSPLKKGGAGDDAVLPIPEIADLSFYDQVPTVWDDTKILDGYPEKFAVVARKKADNWYLGVLTGNEPHSLSLNLDFLDKGKEYMATIYSDDESLNTISNIKIQEQEVTSETILSMEILKQNGAAVIFSLIK